MRSLYKVTDAAPTYVNGARVAPGDLLSMSDQAAAYERDLGYIEATTAETEAHALDISDVERAALPALVLAEGADTVAGVLSSDIPWSASPIALLPLPATDAAEPVAALDPAAAAE